MEIGMEKLRYIFDVNHPGYPKGFIKSGFHRTCITFRRDEIEFERYDASSEKCGTGKESESYTLRYDEISNLKMIASKIILNDNLITIRPCLNKYEGCNEESELVQLYMEISKKLESLKQTSEEIAGPTPIETERTSTPVNRIPTWSESVEERRKLLPIVNSWEEYEEVRKRGWEKSMEDARRTGRFVPPPPPVFRRRPWNKNNNNDDDLDGGKQKLSKKSSKKSKKKSKNKSKKTSKKTTRRITK